MDRDAIYELKVRKWKLSPILSLLMSLAYSMHLAFIIESFYIALNKINNWL